MKRFLKLMGIPVSVLFICLSVSSVNAYGSYYESATSSYHRYGTGYQYFVIDAECRDFGSDRSVNNWTYEWYHGGTGSHNYNNAPVAVVGRGNYQVFYSGRSTIDGNKVQNCSATLTY